MSVADRWSVLTALADPSRRVLYEYVCRQGRPVTRGEAADAAQVSRGLAAFHLDKLVDVGLLLADYQAPPGQPRGRGRAPKVYRAAGDGLAITIPERRYELIAEILTDAVADDPAHADEAARRHAHRHGAALGTRLRGTDLRDVLAGLGFEPDAGHPVVLHNCPFHALAARQTPLVCGLNHSFLTGLVDGLDLTGVHARLAPRPGACCVELATDGDGSGRPGGRGRP
jgi:predicted ArsR family transcriptional regulator